jgi:hypothetical protein
MLQSTLTALSLALALAAGQDPPDGVRLKAAWAEAPLRAAVLGAARRLSEPVCASLLDEFEDRDGRALRLNLRRVGMGPGTYARSVLFYDGFDESACRENRRRLAFTTPGSRVVRVCRSLIAMGIENPEQAQAIVLHEVLHTLGLGENPPDQDEITRAVVRRCFPR